MLTTTLSLLVAAGAGALIVLALWIRDRQRLVRENARLEAERDAAARADERLRTELAGSQAQLREAFAALAHSAIKENRDEFLGSAQSLLDPVKQSLERVQRYLAEVDRAREGSHQAIASELSLLRDAHQQLRSAAEGLSRSLGSPNVRGVWGEVQLRRIVELAGMLPHCDFLEKPSAESESGSRQTPDLLIRLPGGATVVIDAKVPIQSYRAAAGAADEAARAQALDAHARQVREHIRALGAKEYWKQFQPAPDFVVMFLPLEPLLAAAFERDEELFDLAASLRVVPATPLTLLALLKAVAAGWRQQELAENAEAIQTLGRQLYDRLATMADHLEALGRNLTQAAASYDSLIGSLEAKVLPSARRFRDLGVSSTRTIEPLDPLHVEVRSIAKTELTGAAESSSPDANATLRLIGNQQ